MYNLSFQSNNSNLIINENIGWYISCTGHFGTNVNLTVSVLCFIVGMPVHCWSLWVSLRRNIKPNVVFPLNITILELLFCIQCTIAVFAFLYPSPLGYHLYMFFVGLVWTCRPIIQICICIEQYLAVIYPVTFLTYKSISYRIGAVGVAWLIASGNTLRLTFFKSANFPDILFILLFCVAVVIVSFCCVSVLWALKRPGPSGRQNVELTEKDRSNKSRRTGENQQKRKAFRIISHILVSILTCYISLVVGYSMIIAKIDMSLCDTVPIILSITVTAVFISSLVRAYEEGHLTHKLFFKLREQIKGK